MRHTATIALAAAIALTASSLVARTAEACGAYGAPTDTQRIRWAISIDTMKQAVRKPGLLRRIAQVHIEGDRARVVVVDGWKPTGMRTTDQRMNLQERWIDLAKRDSSWTIVADGPRPYFSFVSVTLEQLRAWTPPVQKFDLAFEAKMYGKFARDAKALIKARRPRRSVFPPPPALFSAHPPCRTWHPR